MIIVRNFPINKIAKRGTSHATAVAQSQKLRRVWQRLLCIAEGMYERFYLYYLPSKILFRISNLNAI